MNFSLPFLSFLVAQFCFEQRRPPKRKKYVLACLGLADHLIEHIKNSKQKRTKQANSFLTLIFFVFQPQ